MLKINWILKMKTFSRTIKHKCIVYLIQCSNFNVIYIWLKLIVINIYRKLVDKCLCTGWYSIFPVQFNISPQDSPSGLFLPIIWLAWVSLTIDTLT